MNNREKEIFLRKRYSAEKRFRFFGISSIIIALSFFMYFAYKYLY